MRSGTMDNYISLSALNDFIFCPYSIYLHQVYQDTDEDLYHATPQTRGRAAHETVEKTNSSISKSEITAIHVLSEELGIRGKIDLYRKDKKLLVERKYQLKQIYRGQLYQLWGEYFCMLEMGYEIEHIAFYETSTNRTIHIELPGDKEKEELINFISCFRNYDPSRPIKTNRNKCMHCVYCNLCDKSDTENVYS